MPLITRVKKAERLVDKMALVEHMNEASRVQNGKLRNHCHVDTMLTC